MTPPNSLTAQDVHEAAVAATRGGHFVDELRVCRHTYIGEFVHSLNHTILARNTEGKLEINYLRGPSSLTITPTGQLEGPVLKIASKLDSSTNYQPSVAITDHENVERLRLTFDEGQVKFGDAQINNLWTLVDETINPILVGDPNAWKRATEQAPEA